MTAISSTASPTVVATAGRSTLLGFGTFVRKELLEWWRSRRALILLGITTLMMGLNTLSPRLTVLASHGAAPLPPGFTMDPTGNVLFKWPQWIFFFAIVFTMSLMIGERDRGTLAWSLSKPLSRTALLTGKWAAAMIMFGIFGVALPMAACVVAAAVAYGMPDVAAVGIATVLLMAVPAFFIALTLALGTILPSQAAVAATAAGVAVLPGILGQFVPVLADVFPSSIGPWAVGAALGDQVPVATPVAWLAWTLVTAAVAVVSLRRANL